jgi:hypothetical protein
MRAMALLAFSLAAACGNAGSPPNRSTTIPGDQSLPAEAAILPDAAVPALLQQCSRSAPEAGEGTWQPTAADIAALEAALPAALAERARPETANAPQGWRRQYGGIVRGGRRFIYGNFTPQGPNLDGPDPTRWRTSVQIVCDGGPSFFGVEYDVEARRFTHLAFNGSA